MTATLGVWSPAFAITGFSDIDVGAGPGDARPNSDAAAAAFDVAASALGPLLIEDFEAAPLGTFFPTLILDAMTVTFSGTAGSGSGIRGLTADPEIRGYNTTSGGSKHLRLAPLIPTSVPNITSVTLTPDEPVEAWGAYFTGVGTRPNTEIDILFSDGTAQSFDLPGDPFGGVLFFGFTDPGKEIASVTIQETITLIGGGDRDFIGIDDVRFVPVRTVTEINVAAGGTAEHEVGGNTVLAVEVPANVFVGVSGKIPSSPADSLKNRNGMPVSH